MALFRARSNRINWYKPEIGCRINEEFKRDSDIRQNRCRQCSSPYNENNQVIAAMNEIQRIIIGNQHLVLRWRVSWCIFLMTNLINQTCHQYGGIWYRWNDGCAIVFVPSASSEYLYIVDMIWNSMKALLNEGMSTLGPLMSLFLLIDGWGARQLGRTLTKLLEDIIIYEIKAFGRCSFPKYSCCRLHKIPNGTDNLIRGGNIRIVVSSDRCWAPIGSFVANLASSARLKVVCYGVFIDETQRCYHFCTLSRLLHHQ